MVQVLIIFASLHGRGSLADTQWCSCRHSQIAVSAGSWARRPHDTSLSSCAPLRSVVVLDLFIICCAAATDKQHFSREPVCSQPKCSAFLARSPEDMFCQRGALQ